MNADHVLCSNSSSTATRPPKGCTTSSKCDITFTPYRSRDYSAMSLPGEFADEPSSHTTLNGFISRPPFFSVGARPITSGVAPSDIIEALSFSEDGIKKSLVIDMKGLVGDAVGNVCHTPYASSFSHWKVDEHRPLISRLGPCCVRPSVALSFPRCLNFHLIKA